MNPDIAASKESLRREIRSRGVTAQERAAASAALCERLHALDCWAQARAVLFFAPLSDEPDIFPSIQRALNEGKLASLLRFKPDEHLFEPVQIEDTERDLLPGHFGVREPAHHCPVLPMNRLDLLLVPGLAFDLCGRRLGRGKGFYDRLLATAHETKCGVCFDWQMVETVPVEAHDVALNCIVTPTRWLRF